MGSLYGHKNLDFLTFLRLYGGSLIGILFFMVYEIIPGLYLKQAGFFFGIAQVFFSISSVICLVKGSRHSPNQVFFERGRRF